MWKEAGSVEMDFKVCHLAHLEAGVLLQGSCLEEIIDQTESILREASQLVGQLKPFRATPDVAISRNP